MERNNEDSPSREGKKGNKAKQNFIYRLKAFIKQEKGD